MEQSSLVGESLSPPWTILSIGFFSRIGFVHILLDLYEPKPNHHPLFEGLCCVVAAQISGGVVLSWPRSVVVFCFCEAQISGSHTSLYLTITLFLSLRLIWKFLA